MGNATSQEEIDSVGYRVLGVLPNSPAASAGLVSFFDFVVAANNYPLKVLDNKFVDLIKEFENKPLPLTIYNIKSDTTRDVVITPRRNWGGQGMLGVTIRFDSFWQAEESLVRVLEVVRDSPAELAGLSANDDYLLGTAEKVFKNTDTLYAEVSKHVEETIEFYVYNTKSDEVRTAVVMPTNDWKGQGSLGISVGHGYLHRLPASCKTSCGTSSATSSTNAIDATKDIPSPIPMGPDSDQATEKGIPSSTPTVPASVKPSENGTADAVAAPNNTVVPVN